MNSVRKKLHTVQSVAERAKDKGTKDVKKQIEDVDVGCCMQCYLTFINIR